MIGRLAGTLIEKQPPQLLIDIAGVAYEVEASMQTFYQLPELGHKITLHTHLVVREDAHLLFGFYELSERSLFRSLIKVSGVGPKLALAILSTMRPDEFIYCINKNDIKTMTRIPGVGKKTAERLIIEMRDRLKSSNIENNDNQNGAFIDFTESNTSPEQEAISALIALGYKPLEAIRTIRQIYTANQSSEDLIREALKKMMK